MRRQDGLFRSRVQHIVCDAMGAEDYVTKPFNMKILMRRVEVALRRNTAAEQPFSDRWSDGFLTLDFSKLTAVRGDEKIIVTSNEYKLLKALIENAGNILTRQNLLERLWDIEGNFVDDHALTATINRLRAKIEDETHSYMRRSAKLRRDRRRQRGYRKTGILHHSDRLCCG